MEASDQAFLRLSIGHQPPLRDIWLTMAYPFVSLSTKRLEPIRFKDSKAQVLVTANHTYRMATVWDWDIIILFISVLNERRERGLPISRHLEFSPTDVLKHIARNSGGRSYKQLAEAIRRLNFTGVSLRAPYGPEYVREYPFSWLDYYEIPLRYFGEENGNDLQGRPTPNKLWKVSLSEWLFGQASGAQPKGVLAVHPHYFQLRQGVERFLYRIARRSVSQKDNGKAWSFTLETLFQRSGMTGNFRDFNARVEAAVKKGSLPEYGIKLNKKKGGLGVVFYRDASKPPRPRRGIYHPDEGDALFM